MKRTGSNIGSFCSNKSDYKITDTWNASGLRGTGSNDVDVSDAFVAEPMTLAVSDLDGGPTPGSAANPNALFALPVFSLFPYVLSGCGARKRAGLSGRLCRSRAASRIDLQSRQIGRSPEHADQDCRGFREDRRGPADHCARHASKRWPTPGAAMFRISPPRPGCGAMEPIPSISARKPGRYCSRRAARVDCSRPAHCSGSFAMPTPSIRTLRSIW